MAVYDVAFDMEVDWHECIEADDEWEAREIAECLLDNDEFFRHVIEGWKLKVEHMQGVEVETLCVGTVDCEPTITTEGIAHFTKGVD